MPTKEVGLREPVQFEALVTDKEAMRSPRLLGLALVSLLALPSSGFAGPAVPNEFVSGSGRVGDLAFTVTGHDVGPTGAWGQMSLRFADGSEMQARVECVGILEPVASTIGVVGRSTHPAFGVGTTVEFEMVDNGEPGSDPPDLFAFRSLTGPTACQFDGIGHLPLDEGNIELKQEKLSTL